MCGDIIISWLRRSAYCWGILDRYATELPPGKLAKVIPFSFQVQNVTDDFVL